MRNFAKVLIAVVGLAAGVVQIAQYWNQRGNEERKGRFQAPARPPQLGTRPPTLDTPIENGQPIQQKEVDSSPQPLTGASDSSATQHEDTSPQGTWAVQQALDSAEKAGTAARNARMALRSLLYWQHRDTQAWQSAYQDFSVSYANARAAGFDVATRYSIINDNYRSALNVEKLQACQSDLVAAGFRAQQARQLREALQSAGFVSLNAQAFDGELVAYENLSHEFIKCIGFARVVR